MPDTARKYFEEDIERAEDIARHAAKRRAGLGEDLLRAAWVLAIGALDAYLCDAYVDTLCRQLRAYNTGRLQKLPSAYARVDLPAGDILKAGRYASHGNWALRMAARKLMEEENMLALSCISEMFDPALQATHKLCHRDAISAFVRAAPKGLVGVSRSQYQAQVRAGTTEEDKHRARERVWNGMIGELGRRVKRRHEIVHNCDRPREVCCRISEASVAKTIRYVSAFVRVLDEHLDRYRTF